MALTAEQKKELFLVLDRTGAHREAGQAERKIPEEYKKFQELVIRKKVVVDVPAVDLPVECYVTKAKNMQDGCPVHINMHGGGFVYLQDQDDDLYCAHVAAEIHGIVVDIDYASSREYAYPAAFEQCYQVVKWVFEQCELWGADPLKVSMGGHSAGGCLSAAIALKAAQTGDFKVCMQVLDYAANDNYMPMEDASPQAERYRAFSLLYADGNSELLKSPYVSPAYAGDEMLKNQPRTVIIGAEKCPFCELNEKFGLRLAAAGNEVVMKRFKNSRHGFTVRMLDEWQEAQELIIREILNGSGGSRFR